MDVNDVHMLVRSAVPIDDVDELHTGPYTGFPVIWINTEERPDLTILSSQTALEDGYYICSWFYTNPEESNMQIGLRIEMKLLPKM
jgi:hypothetical protein